MDIISFIKTNFSFSLNFQLCGNWGWTNLGNGNIAEIKLTGPSRQTFTMIRVTVVNNLYGEISKRNFLFEDFLKPDVAHCGKADPDYWSQKIPYIDENLKWAFPPITTVPIVEAVENYIKNFG